ncbi:MAG: lytic transglycosylase domain-containing protein [Proteobacteria bacterium]|nr:lytic transglycosylase domain-containing protein [Pseudomonadota bacterium]
MSCAHGASIRYENGVRIISGESVTTTEAGTQPTALQPRPQIYRYKAGRVTVFSDREPARASFSVVKLYCFACSPTSSINWADTRLFRNEYSEAIEPAAALYGVDPALVRAVIHAESGFNAQATSPKGAMGLMQLMPATAREVGVANAYAPEQNIRGGVRYLASLLAQFRNNVTLAAAAYNAGPAAVERYRDVPPYAETQAYVQRVNLLHERYRSRGQ